MEESKVLLKLNFLSKGLLVIPVGLISQIFSAPSNPLNLTVHLNATPDSLTLPRPSQFHAVKSTIS